MATGCTAANGLTEREEREITDWVLNSVATEPEKWSFAPSTQSGSELVSHESGLKLFVSFDWSWGGGYVTGVSPAMSRFQFFRWETYRTFFGLLSRKRRIWNAVVITDAFHALRHRTDGAAIRKFRDMTAPHFRAIDDLKQKIEARAA